MLASRHAGRRRHKLWLEWLEDRTTPTTITVTTSSDAVGHAGTSLRDAIATASSPRASAGSAAGGGATGLPADSSLACYARLRLAAIDRFFTTG